MLIISNFAERFKLIKLIGSVFVILFLGSPAIMMGDTVVDAKFRGEWIAAKDSCASAQLKLKIDSNIVTFINGPDQAKYDKLDQCFSCMGKDVTDFVWLTTDAMGDSPFTIFLDGSKKKVAVSVDFTNDKKLGKRFPFGKAALKRCKQPPH